MSAQATAFDVTSIPEMFSFDLNRLQLAKDRQCALWEGRTPDKWPVILGGSLTPEQQEIPFYNYKEAFDDKERMLCTEVRAAINRADSGSDGLPSLRVNFGTGILLACLGLEQEIYTDKMPWLLNHMTKEEASRLDPEKIEPHGSFARGLEYMQFYRDILGDSIPIFPMDTQGPFDLAHLLIGDDLFMQVYDDPEYVHHIMAVCTSLNIKAHTWMKEISGEPMNHIYHSNHIYAENMGVRICEDTTALLGPDIMQTFAMPYTQQVAQHFGGAWVHYCGRNDHLTRVVLDIPEIRGINFGHIPGHVHDQPFEEMMELVHASGKVYNGPWPMFDNESGTEYIKRMHHWAAKGSILPVLNCVLGTDDELNSKEKVLELWYSL